MKNQFLSTPSARRATERLDEGVGDVVISIHALREEGDTTSRNSKHEYKRNFYPRRPRGGRLVGWVSKGIPGLFLSTPSARRATICSPKVPNILRLFLSTPSARRATGKEPDKVHP